MTYKKIIRGGLASLVFLSILPSCVRGDYFSQSSAAEGGLGVNITSINDPEPYLQNGIAFYFFNPDNTVFLQELSMTKDPDSYTYVSEDIYFGTYDLLVVTCTDSLLTENLKIPSYKTDVMYVMPNDITMCPNIFYFTQDVTIENKREDVTAQMDRNLARVLFKVDDRNNLLDHDSELKITLLDVPSTLSWEGKILSDASGNVITVNLPEKSTSNWYSYDDMGVIYASEDIVYIVPAHRGDDDPRANMSINLATTDKNGAAFERTNVELNMIPPLNAQVRYTLVPSGAGLTIEAELLPWYVEDTQTGSVIAETDLDCIVMGTNASVEVDILDVYKEWNIEGGTFYDLSNFMSQTTEVQVEIIDNAGNAVKSVELVNRSGSWPYAVLAVHSNGVEGEATVGIKLAGDNFNVNGGYRWKWHVLVSDEATECPETDHPDSVNSN